MNITPANPPAPEAPANIAEEIKPIAPNPPSSAVIEDKEIKEAMDRIINQDINATASSQLISDLLEMVNRRFNAAVTPQTQQNITANTSTVLTETKEVKPSGFFNEVDFATQEPIPEKYKIALDNYLFNICSLIEWCNTKNEMHNPYTQQKFSDAMADKIRKKALELKDDNLVKPILVSEGRTAPLSIATTGATVYNPATVPDHTQAQLSSAGFFSSSVNHHNTSYGNIFDPSIRFRIADRNRVSRIHDMLSITYSPNFQTTGIPFERSPVNENRRRRIN